MDSVTLIMAANNIQEIIAFVSGNGLKEAICTIIGDIHLEAALLALETSLILDKPNDRINSVITHLEAAHVAFLHIHDKADNFVDKYFDYQIIRNAVAKDAWVCCIMALCYASLNEKRAVEKCLLLGDRAFENGLNEKKISSIPESFVAFPIALISLLNLRNWGDLQDKLMTVEMYRDFKFNIRAAVNAN